MRLFIRFFFINIASIYCFIKILNLKKLSRLSSKLILVTYVIASSILFTLMRGELSRFIIPTLVTLLFLTLKKIYKLPPLTTITGVLYASGISYGTYTISVFLSVILFSIILGVPFTWVIRLQMIIAVIQSTLCFCIFRIKRFSKGFTFIKNEYYTTIGIFSSLMILILMMLMANNNAEYIYIIPIFCVFLAVIFIYVWSKSRFKSQYIASLYKRELDYLNHEIALLKKDNENLSKLIHKDNKLIPALELATKEYLESDNDKAVGIKLIEQLNDLSQERKGIINRSSHSNIHNTGFISTDSLLNYMNSKCIDNDIEFNFVLAGKLTDYIGNVIAESDFNSILADLIENAIIATKCNNGHHIYTVITADTLTIDVYDSGALFDINVLANLGLKRITTHKGTGTGIGLTSIYEFLDKYQAKFVIDETTPDDHRYTKKVSISFNSSKEYRFITQRSKSEIKSLFRREDIIIEQPS